MLIRDHIITTLMCLTRPLSKLHNFCCDDLICAEIVYALWKSFNKQNDNDNHDNHFIDVINSNNMKTVIMMYCFGIVQIG